MKLLKTIRFDASDERVFELAAAPEEWAVSGAFAFADLAPEAVAGKSQAGLRQRLSRPCQLRPVDLCHRRRGDARRPARGSSARWPRISSPSMELPGSRRRCRRPRRRPASCSTCAATRRSTRSSPCVARGTRKAGIKEEFRTIRPPTGEPLHAKIWTVVDDVAVTSGNRPACICSSAGRRAGSQVTPSFLRAYYTRPEMHPIEGSCEAEVRLHEELMADPLRPVEPTRLAALADPEAADNYRVVLCLSRPAGARRHHRGRLPAADAPGRASPSRPSSSTRWCT